MEARGYARNINRKNSFPANGPRASPPHIRLHNREPILVVDSRSRRDEEETRGGSFDRYMRGSWFVQGQFRRKAKR